MASRIRRHRAIRSGRGEAALPGTDPFVPSAVGAARLGAMDIPDSPAGRPTAPPVDQIGRADSDTDTDLEDTPPAEGPPPAPGCRISGWR